MGGWCRGGDGNCTGQIGCTDAGKASALAGSLLPPVTSNSPHSWRALRSSTQRRPRAREQLFSATAPAHTLCRAASSMASRKLSCEVPGRSSSRRCASQSVSAVLNTPSASPLRICGGGRGECGAGKWAGGWVGPLLERVTESKLRRQRAACLCSRAAPRSTHNPVQHSPAPASRGKGAPLSNSVLVQQVRKASYRGSPTWICSSGSMASRQWML